MTRRSALIKAVVGLTAAGLLAVLFLRSAQSAREAPFTVERGHLTPWKQQRIVRMAVDFLARRRWLDQPCRFDVVTVDFEGGKPRIEVYPHAFTA